MEPQSVHAKLTLVRKTVKNKRNIKRLTIVNRLSNMPSTWKWMSNKTKPREKLKPHTHTHSIFDPSVQCTFSISIENYTILDEPNANDTAIHMLDSSLINRLIANVHNFNTFSHLCNTNVQVTPVSNALSILWAVWWLNFFLRAYQIYFVFI